MPARRASRRVRKRTAAAAGRHRAGDDQPRAGSPPHRSRISRVACSVPGRTSAGSRPRSKRVRASLSIPSLRPVAAVRSGSNSATSSTTSVGLGVQPVRSPPMMPPRLIAAAGVGDHGHAVGRARRSCRRAPAASRPARARRSDDVALQLAGVEHVQRPAEVEGQVVGDVDQGRDRPQADRLQPRAAARPGSGPLLTPRITRPTNSGQALARRRGKASAIASRRAERPATGVKSPRLQRAEAGGREIAGDAATPKQSPRSGVSLTSITGPSRPSTSAAGVPTSAVRGQLDDAAMVVAELQLARGAQHAVAGDAADRGLLQDLAR